MSQLEIPGLESIKTIMEQKGTKVISSSGKRNFEKEDKEMLKGVKVVNAANSGHLDIDRSSIIQMGDNIK